MTQGYLRRAEELEVVGARLELVLIVVAADPDRDDLASVYPEGASILDDHTASLAAADAHDDLVAYLQRPMSRT